jgi:hypothetical protein
MAILISTSKNALSFLLHVCLFFNKIRDKGRTVSAWKRGGGGEKERLRVGGEMTQTLHAHVNKQQQKKRN